MKIKTLVAATLAGFVAASFSCVAAPAFKLVDDTTTMQNSGTDSTDSTPASGPTNVGSNNGQNSSSTDNNSNSNNNDDMSADTATGDDDY